MSEQGIAERLRNERISRALMVEAADELDRLQGELAEARKLNRDWVAANAPGGWIDDLRKRKDH
jgi:hypothetical protein